MPNRVSLTRVISAALVIASAGTTLLTVHAQGITAPLPDLKGRNVVVVTAQDYVPLTFVDAKSGIPTGMEYELWRELCIRLNCTITFKAAAWDGMIAAVNQKQYDVGMDGISITDERKSQVDFSDSYLTITEKFLVRANQKDFTDSKSFGANPKLKIGAQAGTSGYYSALDILGIKDGDKSDRLVLYNDFGLSVQGLLSGDVDAVISDVAAGRGYIGANAGKLQLLDETLSSDSLGFMFPKGSDLVKPVNAALAAMKTDGYLTYLNNKWFFLFNPGPDAAGNPLVTPAATSAATAAPTMAATMAATAKS